jgi:hypothetical protein
VSARPEPELPLALYGQWQLGLVSGTYSCNNGTITTHQQLMEGNLQLSPGTTLDVGYDFTAPGNNGSVTVSVVNPQVMFAAACVSGAMPSATTFTVSMPNATYTFTGSGWIASGDQNSSLVYEGSISVPNLSKGGLVSLQQRGTFSATIN